MSNKRFIIFFLLGCVFFSLLLLGLYYRSKLVASVATRSVLCTFDPETIDSFEIAYREGNAFSLKKSEQGEWYLLSPFEAETDISVVARFLDSITQTQLGDMLSDNEVGAIGRRLSDFGLRPAKLSLTLQSKEKKYNINFGSHTPSRNEVYARVNELKNVFAVSAEVLNSIPRTPDEFRRHAILSCYPDEISSIEFRVPGTPYVKLVNEESGWQFIQPFQAMADVNAINKLIAEVASSKAVSFEWPVTSSDNQSTLPQQKAENTKIPLDRLVGFGIERDNGLSLTIRTYSGDVEQIVFGGVAGTNLIYALVQNESAVVKVDSKLAEYCKNSLTSFRDMRIFPIAKNDSISSVSITVGQLVYVLSQNADHIWQLDAPVVAPADQAFAVELIEKILTLKQIDVNNSNSDNIVSVSVNTSSTNFPSVKVPTEFFGKVESFADLRSKILLQLDIPSIKRISVKNNNDAPTVVSYNQERNLWNLEKSRRGKSAVVNQDAVKKLLTTLVRVDAVSVETVAASLDDINRCGLDNPEYTIAVDLQSDDAVRKNILIGHIAPGGGRYATIGGMDAVFILSRSTVAALTIPITE